jgi:hypothetical protein
VIPLDLGFDTLAVPEMVNYANPWGAVGREAFLLRPEIEAPISVDRLICPSIFQPEVQRSEESKIMLTRFTPSLPVNRTVTQQADDWPESDLNILGLWTDFRKMLSWAEQKPDLKKFIRFPIAIQMLLEPEMASELLWLTVTDTGQKPVLCADEWPLLGYDVADRGRISALSDCSYDGGDLREARLRWGNYVNDWGLLNDLKPATSFREVSNERIREHAPFYTYRVVRIPHESGISAISAMR